MVDYIGAIKKPAQDIQTLAIGTIIGLIPIVGLLNLGYGVGVGRKTLKGDNSLPKWDAGQLGTYVKDLAYVLIISLVYMIPAFILFGMAVAGFLAGAGGAFGAAMGGNTEQLLAAVIAGIGAGGIFFVLGGIFAIIGGVFSSMGIFFYIKEGSIGSAFKFSEILKKVLTVTYWSTLIIYVAYAFVLGILATILAFVPVIGALVAAGLLSFLTNVTSYTLLAQVFKETP